MHDLVVVGAGPYGLSIAAHAAAAKLDVRVFGRPMASWRDHMPDGMFLKSEPWASNLSDAAGERTLSAYCATLGRTAEHGRPLPIDVFTGYGLWFADRLGVPVEERTVTSVAGHGAGFRVETADGCTALTRTVALAVGVTPFVRLPRPLRVPELHRPGAGLVSHSSDHSDLTRFRGREVAVVGAGQAALETAALLAECGARPVVIARADRIVWNTPPQPLRRGRLARLRAPHSGLGTGWSSWAWAELPAAFRLLPDTTRARVAATAMGPAGAWWLRERVADAVPIRLGHRLLRAEPLGRADGVRLELVCADGAVTDGRLADGTLAGGIRTAGAATRTVQTGHVIAATGFVPDLRRLRVLDPLLRGGLETVRGTRAPQLGRTFESSRPGLFFAGLLTAPSFGPSMRFVYGAGFTAARLVTGVRRRLANRR